MVRVHHLERRSELTDVTGSERLLATHFYGYGLAVGAFDLSLEANLLQIQNHLGYLFLGF